jgi:hypothetical protein
MELLTNLVDQCPWCGEAIDIAIDCSYGDHSYVEDCSVCCAPIQMDVSFPPTSVEPLVQLRREND